MKITRLSNDISIRRTGSSSTEEQLQAVKDIIRTVREEGDAALLRFSRKWDGADLTELRVSSEEIRAAVERFDPQLRNDLTEAAENIRKYHEEQKQESYTITQDNGSYVGQRVTAIESAGLYVP